MTEEQKVAHAGNWQSRKETLTALFNRFIEECEIQLEPCDAVPFTTPLCDALFMRLGQIPDYSELYKANKNPLSIAVNNTTSAS
jgi:hypothetical protein